jgi:hypothetical protein
LQPQDFTTVEIHRLAFPENVPGPIAGADLPGLIFASPTLLAGGDGGRKSPEHLYTSFAARVASEPEALLQVLTLYRFKRVGLEAGPLSQSHDLARIIHNADARLLDRHIESSKIVHAALLLLMIEAAYADLVSPSA